MLTENHLSRPETHSIEPPHNLKRRTGILPVFILRKQTKVGWIILKPWQPDASV